MGQVGIRLCIFPSHFWILCIFSRLIFWTSFKFTNLILLGVTFYLLNGCFFHVLCSFGFNLDFDLCCLFVVALFLGCFMLLLHSFVFSSHFGSISHHFQSGHHIFTVEGFFIGNKSFCSSFNQLM